MTSGGSTATLEGSLLFRSVDKRHARKARRALSQRWPAQRPKKAPQPKKHTRVSPFVIGTMIGEHGRGGRHHGGGFYEYGADGSKHIWPQLLDLFYKPDVELPDQDIKDRLLFRQVIEALKCLQTNVLRTVADGNIGSIMGIGAPVWTGGLIQFVNTYGLEKFQARCAELAATYGDRFDCPAIVAEKLAAGELFE